MLHNIKANNYDALKTNYSLMFTTLNGKLEKNDVVHERNGRKCCFVDKYGFDRDVFLDSFSLLLTWLSYLVILACKLH